jgi:hypothetical protein
MIYAVTLSLQLSFDSAPDGGPFHGLRGEVAWSSSMRLRPRRSV